MREKVLLDEFTWPELYQKISRSDVAYFPVGTQEGHGPHLPMGTDVYVATGTGVLASQKGGGVVLHPLGYCFTGATNAFRGTVSIPMHLEMEVIKAIIRNLWQQKFRAIFVLSIHEPNEIPIMMALRELFEYERITASYFNPYTFIDAKKYGYDEPAKEAAMCYASMELLGLGELIPDLTQLKDEEKPPLDLPGRDKLRTGYHFTHMLQHMPTRKVEVAKGMQMLDEVSDELISQVDSLREYSRFIEQGGNPPFSVKP